MNYVDLIIRAREMENEAIKIGLLALALAPPEDVPTLVEITNDENDHDGLYTDIILRELGKVAGGGAPEAEVTDGGPGSGPHKGGGLSVEKSRGRISTIRAALAAHEHTPAKSSYDPASAGAAAAKEEQAFNPDGTPVQPAKYKFTGKVGTTGGGYGPGEGYQGRRL